MRTLKVRLYIRVRLHDGRYAYLDPVWNKNHTLRAGYALVGGKPESHEEGIYYLRCLRDGKRVWQAVGPEADAAAAALQNKEHDLQSDSLGRSTPAMNPYATPGPGTCPGPVSTPPAPASVSLEDAIKSYMAEVRRFRAPKTIAAAQHMLALFGAQFPGKCVQNITREDLLDHMAALQERGLGQRTIYNHIARIPLHPLPKR